jgi:hypothetical protein
MQYTNVPLYVSSPTMKSLGNEYSIFPDRIDLRCRYVFFHIIISVKKEDIVSIEVFKPPVLRTSFKALKLDLADFYEHVGITRKGGTFSQLRFTPEYPQKFVAAAKEAFNIDNNPKEI